MEKYGDVTTTLVVSESGEYLLAAIKKWLKDNVIEVEWEGERRQDYGHRGQKGKLSY